MRETRVPSCSLPDDALGQRLALIRRDLLPHVTRTEQLPNGVAWEFERTSAMHAQLERFVAFERECCSGLAFDLQTLSNPDRLRLTVEGAGAERLARFALGG